MCTARAPMASTGRMSERTELPTITKRFRSMSWRSRMRSYVGSSFSLMISMCQNSSARPLRASFCSWWSRSPLVMSTRR